MLIVVQHVVKHGLCMYVFAKYSFRKLLPAIRLLDDYSVDISAFNYGDIERVVKSLIQISDWIFISKYYTRI